MARRRWMWVGGGVGVLGIAAGIALAAHTAPNRAAEPAIAPVVETRRPVLVTRVTFGPRQAERSFVGTIRPRVETEVGFRVPGKVARRLVNVGDRVAAGQPLATLDEIDLTLQAEQAQAELRAAQASMSQVVGDLRRSEALTSRGYAATASLDKQRAVVEEARGRQLRSERAVTLAANSQSYAVLRADAEGVVVHTAVEPGQVVTAGQAAITVAHSGEREAQVAIPEGLVGRAKRGQSSVTLWSNPGTRYEAKLRELAPAADAATRTYQARFSIPQADDAVQLGMTATVTLVGEASEKVARLPLSALFNQGAGASVWVVGPDGRPALTPVEVLSYEAQEVLVRSGVREGDQVITLGVSKIDAGQTLRVVDALQF